MSAHLPINTTLPSPRLPVAIPQETTYPEIAEVDAWIYDLRAICEVAFYDDRSKLEALGPLAPTFHHAGKKKPVAASKILKM